MDQALNSQKTPHTSPLRASYGMSFVSILMKNDRVIKGFYCTKPMETSWAALVAYTWFQIISQPLTNVIDKVFFFFRKVCITDVQNAHDEIVRALQYFEINLNTSSSL